MKNGAAKEEYEKKVEIGRGKESSYFQKESGKGGKTIRRVLSGRGYLL